MTEMSTVIGRGVRGHRRPKSNAFGELSSSTGQILNAGGDAISPRAPHWLVCELGGQSS